MTTQKTKLAVALGAVLGAAVVAPSAQAVNLATDGLGEALVTEYYTVRNGYNTMFNLTNTSGLTVVVKARFHEGYNSRDVFDFNIVLSPYDVWTGYVTMANGVPVLRTDDNSCTVPTITPGGPGQPFVGRPGEPGVPCNGPGCANGTLAYTGTAADGGPTGFDRLLEGYVTFVQMGAADPAVSSLAAAAVHQGPGGGPNPGGNQGVPANCPSINSAFAVGTTAGIQALKLDSDGFNGWAPNALKGNWTVAKGSAGLTTAGEMVTFANFFAPTTGRGNNLMTLQLPPDAINVPSPGDFQVSFHEPTLHSANTPGQVLLADGTLAATNYPGGQVPPAVGGADAVSWTIARSAVINQWSRRISPATGWATATDWVLSFPTKRFYSDRATNQWAGRAADRANLGNFGQPDLAEGLSTQPGVTATASPFAQIFGQVEDGKACDPFTAYVYDREEYEDNTPGGPVFSPAPTPEGDEICYEVNVVTFDDGNVFDSKLVSNLTNLPAGNGWMQMNLGNAASNLEVGLPVVGYAVVTRSTDRVMLNDSVNVPHAYDRNVIDPNVIVYPQ